MVKKSKTQLSDENLSSAVGGFTHYDAATDTYQIIGNKGNLVGSQKTRADAEKVASQRGLNNIELTDEDVRFLKEKKYLDLNGTRYYSDGYSRPL